MEQKQTHLLYRFIKRCVRWVYPKIAVIGAQQLPPEPAILVANHCQAHGPIISELYLPGVHDTWCIGEMMHRKEVPAYAFQDFWSGKPKALHWFYRLLSHLIAPLSVFVFRNANTIAVYHDARLVHTFKDTVQRLSEGSSIVIFPEHYAPHSNIVHDFQDKFIDVARLYYRKTGQALCFVPVYNAPMLRKTIIGKPLRFDPALPMPQQRRKICDYLMDEITRMACALEPHTVVPYPNVPRKEYPQSLPRIDYKEVAHEEACR